MNKTVVIYHKADFDGLFCREIAKKFMPDAELIGWDYGDPVPIVPKDAQLYMLDISIGNTGLTNEDGLMNHPNLVWIDHHKSAMEKYAASIRGYRIDGVAACRLAWQYLSGGAYAGPDSVPPLPEKQDFIDRKVDEPWAVRLAGEYDVWDKRDPDAEMFQFGLRSMKLDENDWTSLLLSDQRGDAFGRIGSYRLMRNLLDNGKLLQQYQQRTDAGAMFRSFMVEFEGLKFLTLTTARCNSQTFESRDNPPTGHDALMGLYFDGSNWKVSLYHARHRTELDLSKIAVRYGGGGHRGACGFQTPWLPFLTDPSIPTRKGTLLNDLAFAINVHSRENGSNTPDFILAEYLLRCLENFDLTVNTREKWYGRSESKDSLP